jgi:hypothetical protein
MISSWWPSIGHWAKRKGVEKDMQTYKVGDKVSPFNVNRHELWGEVVRIRRWGRGYSCHVHWDRELWRLNGKKASPGRLVSSD